MTTQDMIDEATEEGACSVAVSSNAWVKVTDEGEWYHYGITFGEILIDRERALDLLEAAREASNA